MIIPFFVIFLIFSSVRIVSPALHFSLSPKLFRVANVVKCPNTKNLSYPILTEKLAFAKKPGKPNIFTLTGIFNVTEKIYDPIEVRIP